MGYNYTIIIPHYDIPDLLIRCLNSIPIREDTEIIVVDDNSPGAENYLNQYSILKERHDVKLYFTKEGKGAGYARNVGLSYATGKWLLFADADDFFVSDLSDILDKYKEAMEDILYFRHLSVMSDDISLPARRENWLNRLFDRYFEEHDDKYIRCNHCVPWGKIIRHDLIRQNKIHFDEVKYSNDVMFGIQAGCLASRISIVDRPLYVLTERLNSLTTSFATKPGELGIRANVSLRAHLFLKGQGFTYTDLYGAFSMTTFLSKMYHRDKELFIEYFKSIPDIYPSYLSALKQLRIYETGKWNKIKLYLYSGWVYLKQTLKFQNRNHK